MDMLGVTFIAVSKVIVSVLIGVLATHSIPNSETTLRDFGFLISTVLLSSLTISNTSQSVTLELLVRCSILILFSVLMIAWGLLWGVVFGAVLFRWNPKYSGIPAELRKDVRLDLLFEEKAPEELTAKAGAASNQQGSLTVSAAATAGAAGSPSAKKKRKKKRAMIPYVAVVLSEHYREVGVTGQDIVPALDVPDKHLEDIAGCRWAMWVGCSTQNGVTLPISLLTNIAGSVAFVDFAQSAAYIFVFAVSYMLYIWSAGPVLVDRGEKAATKQRIIRELMDRHKRMTGRCDATTQTLSFPVNHALQLDTPSTPSQEDTASADSENEMNSRSNSSAATAEGHDGQEGEDSGENKHTKKWPASALSRSIAAQAGSRPMDAADTRGTSAAVAFTVPGVPSCMSPTTADRYAFTMATAEQLPYDWQAAGFIRVRYESEIKALKRQTLPEKLASLAHGVWGLMRKLLVNPPFISVVIGIIIGVVTPIHNLFFNNGYLEMVMDAIALIGTGSIPASLLLLGANLVGSASGPAESVNGDMRLRHAEQNTVYPLRDEDWELLGENGHFVSWYDTEHMEIKCNLHESFSAEASRELAQGSVVYTTDPPGATGSRFTALNERKRKKSGFFATVEKAVSLAGANKSFVWGVIGVRLVLAPAFSFVALIFMIKTMPFLFGGRGSFDKTLIMVLMVELASPTAINSTLIFNAKQFMTYTWAKMLFFQYILCSVSMVIWASLGLSYISKLE